MNQEKLTELEMIISRDYSNIAGMVVQKKGQILYEKYFNQCTADSRIHVFSVTKSIVSILIGIAMDRGYIKSIDQKILDFFPEYTLKKREKTIQKVSLENLLTMTAPYKYKWNPYTKYFTSNDWVSFSLDLLGGRDEIGKFKYAPLIGPDILSGILVKTTGKSVLDFAREHLFYPLGISVKSNVTFDSKEEQFAFYKATDISGWVADPCGVNTAGWGLTLTPVDMAKIGQLYLNDGVWDGKQIVSQRWVKESTQKHSRWEQQGLDYGYLWWLVNNDEHSYAAMGDGGNTIYVNTKRNIVISIASLFVPKVKDRIELIQQYIEPLCED